MQLSEKDYDSAHDLHRQCQAYFRLNVGTPYTLEGLALHCGFSDPKEIITPKIGDDESWKFLRKWVKTTIKNQRKLQMFEDSINIKAAERDLNEYFTEQEQAKMPSSITLHFSDATPDE